MCLVTTLFALLLLLLPLSLLLPMLLRIQLYPASWLVLVLALVGESIGSEVVASAATTLPGKGSALLLS
jgi:hypothetical protein